MSTRGKQIGRYVEDYVIFDLETTGISPVRDAIIEISAIRVRKGTAEAEFSTLVNPGRHIPAGASAVNGITDDMVADAPDIREAMTAFLAFIGEDVLVGHNIHSFDMKFVYLAAEHILERQVPNDYIDTLPMARRILPELGHHKLTDVSQYFDIATEGAHRALCDCTMNQLCYEALRGLAARRSTGEGEKEMSCPSCGSPLIKRKGRFGEFYGCTGFPGCRYTRNL